MSPESLLGLALGLPTLGALLVVATGRLPNLRDGLSSAWRPSPQWLGWCPTW